MKSLLRSIILTMDRITGGEGRKGRGDEGRSEG